MATIDKPQLAVNNDPPRNLATVVASCDVEFTDFEVNAMNLLQLQYTLECRILNKDIQYETTVVTYPQQDLPRVANGAMRSEHIVFETIAVRSDLHIHVFTKDQLIAEFRLKDEETGTVQVERSEVLTVDLEA